MLFVYFFVLFLGRSKIIKINEKMFCAIRFQEDLFCQNKTKQRFLCEFFYLKNWISTVASWGKWCRFIVSPTEYPTVSPKPAFCGPIDSWRFETSSLTFLVGACPCEKGSNVLIHNDNRRINECLRSYPCENTRSHPNSEVKHMWAGLVEWWVTTFESPVLKAFLFSFSFFFFFFLLVWG